MSRTLPADILLAIVRSPDALTARLSRRRAETPEPAGGDVPSAASLYDVQEIPLASAAQRHRSSELTAAWDRLAAAAPEGPRMLADLLLVLLSTVPPIRRPVVAPLRLKRAPKPIQATAAHPRAFKGTHVKPPKTPAPAPCDLRAHLCVEANTQRLLDALWPRRIEAAHRLQGWGIDRARLDRLTSTARPPVEPYVAFHHEDAARTRLGAAFVARVLPSLRGAPWPLVRRAAALHERLRLSEDDALAALAARVLHAAPPDRGLAWWSVLECLPPERRRVFLAQLLETGASDEDPGAVPRAVWIDVGHHAAPERYERWLEVVLQALSKRQNIVYLATGIRFAAQHEPDARLHRVGDAPDFDAHTAELIERLLPASWDGGDLLSLWATCGAVPAFASHLRQTDWTRFSREQTEHLLRFFMRLPWSRFGVGGVSPRHWRALRASLGPLESRILEVPPAYTSQYLHVLGEILGGMSTPAQIADRFPRAINLCARLNRPPFSEEGNLAWAIRNLLKLPEPERRQVMDAPDSSFLRLDKASRRENDATLIAWGLSGLVERAPRLVADALVAAPGTLFRTARQLGVFSWELRRELVASCVDGPAFAEDLETRPIEELVAFFTAAPAPAGEAVPRALREHLDGQRVLTPAQIERHTRVVREALPSLRLAVIRAAAAERLAASVGTREAHRETLSALAFLPSAEENRRGLRRFLRAHLNGDDDYLLQHAATRGWARRHPRVDLGLWTRGPIRQVALKGVGNAVLRVENDPLEVLKMGTYVGSCVGLGGDFSSSAAAVLLDVNKQVVYARDARGRVLARQLLAISDDDHLVAFRVYPASTSVELQRHFDAYDRAFAEALGILRLPDMTDYTIENVLSHDWWDDMPWDAAARKALRSS